MSDKDMEITEQTTKKEKPNMVLSLLDFFEIVVFSITVVILIFSFVMRLCVVNGGSMNPTLINGERLLVSDLFYKPECGDIIVFHQTGEYDNEPMVKRVIAVGGETVDIDFDTKSDTCTVTITDKNGYSRILDEPYAQFIEPIRSAQGNQTYPLYVPDGYVFVMGDNRYNSKDSRDLSVGLVDERRILGKAILRVAPFDKFGTID